MVDGVPVVPPGIMVGDVIMGVATIVPAIPGIIVGDPTGVIYGVPPAPGIVGDPDGMVAVTVPVTGVLATGLAIGVRAAGLPTPGAPTGGVEGVVVDGAQATISSANTMVSINSTEPVLMRISVPPFILRWSTKPTVESLPPGRLCFCLFPRVRPLKTTLPSDMLQDFSNSHANPS